MRHAFEIEFAGGLPQLQFSTALLGGFLHGRPFSCPCSFEQGVQGQGDESQWVNHSVVHGCAVFTSLLACQLLRLPSPTSSMVARSGCAFDVGTAVIYNGAPGSRTVWALPHELNTIVPTPLVAALCCSVWKAVPCRRAVVESYDVEKKTYRLDIKRKVPESMLELCSEEGAGAPTAGIVSKQAPNRPDCIVQAQIDDVACP